MGNRTITGHLAADPEVVQAGQIEITRLVVLENTGERRNGSWEQHPDPTRHACEARFELGRNSAASLRTGDAVIVIGNEHTTSWEVEGDKRYRRVIQATSIGADLSRASVVITRNPKED